MGEIIFISILIGIVIYGLFYLVSQEFTISIVMAVIFTFWAIMLYFEILCLQMF